MTSKYPEGFWTDWSAEEREEWRENDREEREMAKLDKIGDPIDRNAMKAARAERMDSIEEERRQRRANKVQAIVDDANARPGYHKVGFKALFSAEGRAWRKAANQAVRDGKIERDIYGKFWPKGKRPPLTAFAADLLPYAVRVGLLIAFFGMVRVAVHVNGAFASELLGILASFGAALVALIIAGFIWRMEY